MADTKNQVTAPVEKEAENPRKAIREAREKRLRLIDGPPTTVKVYAANESVRATMRHSSGTRFKAELNQSVEWPNDSFTFRRIRDGSVRTEGPGTAQSKPVDESLNPREQAEANKPKKAEQQREVGQKNGNKPAQSPQTPPPGAA